MTWTINANAHRELSRFSSQPIGLVTIHVPPKRCLTVTDFGAIPPGSEIQFSINAVGYTLTEGADWDASLSDEATADSIVAAFNAAPFGSSPRVRARREGVRVIVAGGATTTLLTFDALPAGVEELVAPAEEQRRFLLSDQQLFGYPMSVGLISGLGAKLDPMTREFSIDDLEIEFVDDGAVRRLCLDYYLRGRQVDVAIGTPALAEGDFQQIGTWYIEDVRPGSDGSIVLQLHDAMGFFRDRVVAKRWVNWHPAQLFLDIMQLAVNWPSIQGSLAGMVDEASLDPSVDPATSHWTISRYADELFKMGSPVDEPTPALDLMNELLTILGGTWSPDETGLWRYRPYDENAVPVRTWQAGLEDGWDVDDIEVVETWGNAANEINIDFASQEGSKRTRFQLGHDQARNEIGKLYSMAIDTEWINGLVNAWTQNNPGGEAVISAGATDFALPFAARQGFCGSRFRLNGDGSFTAESGGDLDGAANPPRRAYFRFEGPGREPGSVAPNENLLPEIIACDRSEPEGGRVDAANVRGDIPMFIRFYVAGTFTDPTLGFVSGRAGFGTQTPYQWNLVDQAGGGAHTYQFARVIDVTIPVEMALRCLRRFAYGASVIRVRTGLEQLDLEVGDFVSIEGDPIFVGYRHDGLTAATKWEVTKKLIDPWSDSPAIEWELTWARDDVVPVLFQLAPSPDVQLQLTPLPIDERIVADDLEDIIADDGEWVVRG